MVDISPLLRNDKGLPAKIRWHLNAWLLRHLRLLDRSNLDAWLLRHLRLLDRSNLDAWLPRHLRLLDRFNLDRNRGPKARNKPAQVEARNERRPGCARRERLAPTGRDNDSGHHSDESALKSPGPWLTVHDAFGAPGDTLLTAIICRHIATHFPSLRINCITPNPELLKHDPHIHQLNGPETYLCLRHWYLELIEHKQAETNVLAGSMRTLGISTYDYRASVFLTDAERSDARSLLGVTSKPILSLNTRSKEPVKNWPADQWHRLAALLQPDFDLIQLGDETELALDGVRSFAGRSSFRESMALLSHAGAHIGPDSFLMHAANGLGVPSVILFGGSRTPANLGYAGNINLYVPMPCGPCYIHQSRGEKCAYSIDCMNRITVDEVYAAVSKIIGRSDNKS